MTESPRHNSFLNELNSIETQVSIVVSKLQDAETRIAELEDLLLKARAENNNLQMQLSSIGQEITNELQEGELIFSEGVLSEKERSGLKSRITEIINKINNQLSS